MQVRRLDSRRNAELWEPLSLQLKPNLNEIQERVQMPTSGNGLCVQRELCGWQGSPSMWAHGS